MAWPRSATRTCSPHLDPGGFIQLFSTATILINVQVWGQTCNTVTGYGLLASPQWVILLYADKRRGTLYVDGPYVRPLPPGEHRASTAYEGPDVPITLVDIWGFLANALFVG